MSHSRLSGAVTVLTPEAKPKPARPDIGSDGVVTIACAHREAANAAKRARKIDRLQYRHPDEIFELRGPLRIKHEVPDFGHIFDPKPKGVANAIHEIRGIAGFGCARTLLGVLDEKAKGSELLRRPLFKQTIRLVWFSDFVARISGDPDFSALLDGDRATYVEQLRASREYLGAPNPNIAPDESKIGLVQRFLPGAIASPTPGASALELAPIDRLLTGDLAANIERGNRKPIVLGLEEMPISTMDLAIDRIDAEIALIGLMKGTATASLPELDSRLNAATKTTDFQLRAVFAAQLPDQEIFYGLEELRAQAERCGPRKKHYELINASVVDLVADARSLGQLRDFFPGPKTRNLSKAVGLVSVIPERDLTKIEIEAIARVVAHWRAVLALPKYTRRRFEDVGELVKPGGPYYGLHGINAKDQEWKRVVVPFGGSVRAIDPQNPFIDGVVMPLATIVAGMMLENDSRLAVPIAGKNFPIELRGPLGDFIPSLDIDDSDREKALERTANVGATRTNGQYEECNGITLSDEPGYNQYPTVRCRQQLERNVSELLLNSMYELDSPNQREILKAAIDDYLAANSDPHDDTKMFSQGKVVSITNAVDPDTGQTLDDVLHILVQVGFKSFIGGYVLKVVPSILPVKMTAIKDADKGNWSLD